MMQGKSKWFFNSKWDIAGLVLVFRVVIRILEIDHLSEIYDKDNLGANTYMEDTDAAAILFQ